MDLSNRLFLVVGGTSGIGLAIARAAIAKGARVVVVGRNAERLQSALGSLGPNARGVAADVTNEDEVARLAKDVGNFDHLVVSTIDAHNEPIRTFDASAAAQTVASKLFAAALLAKHTSPQLAENGSITFISGITAVRPMPGGSMGAAANGALHSLVYALALELAPLRVNALSPGWVDTPAWDRITTNKHAAFAQMAAKLPVRRVGTPDDLAHAAMFLAENTYTTGIVLPIDGGHRLC